MKKKGDLQFEALAQHDLGEYQGFALNTEGNPVAQVGISEDDAHGGHKVSWAIANQEGRVRAGPHMLLAMMSRKYGLEPHADKSLSPEGSKMTRSAMRRGLIKPHPKNPEALPTTTQLHGTSRNTDITTRMMWAHGDTMAEADELEARFDRFTQGSVADARKMIFPKRTK